MIASPDHSFLFTDIALETGCSVDFVLGPDVLLHIKPVRQRGVLVVNDRRGPLWGEEMIFPIGDEAWREGVRVELRHDVEGVDIGLPGLPAWRFARCGDLRQPGIALQRPAAVLEAAAAPSAAPKVERESPAEEPAALQPYSIPYAVAAPAAEGASAAAAAGDAAADMAVPTGLSAEAAQAMLLEQFRLSQWPQVVALAEAYRETLGQTREIVTCIGRARLYLGQLQEAVAELGWLRRHAPSHHGGLFYLGVALAKLQRLEEAREILLGCVAQRGGEAKYVFELARVTSRLVNGGYGVAPPRPELLDEAIELMTRAAGLMLRDGRPHRDLSGLLLQKQRLPEALAALDEAQRRSPRLSMLAVERARLLVRLDRIEEALHNARAAQVQDPANDAAASMVRILERWLAARRSGPFRVGLLATPAETGAEPA